MVDFTSLELGFAFVAGSATFFAPCAFPLLPGYVAYYVGTDDDDEAPQTKRSLVLRAGGVGLLTSLGFFVVYGVIGGLVLAVGSRVLSNVSVLELVVGLILIVIGGLMAVGRFDPGALHVQLPERRRGPLGYFLFGVIYAAAAAGCTVGVIFGVASLALAAGPVGAVATFGAYAAGMSLLMVGVTVLTALGRDVLVRRMAANTGRITRFAGVVLVLAGLVQIYYFLFRFDGLRMLGF